MITSQVFSLGLAVKFSKFMLVGASGVVVDFAITYFLKERLKLHKYFSSSVGFIVAASSNFLLNRNWTFKVFDNGIVQFQNFCLFALAGLIMSNILIFLFIKKFNWSLYMAKICTVFIISLWNFVSNYLFTFS